MTIEEAIAHAQETADTRTDLCEECRDEHRQLADWLTELFKLCEENDTLKTEIMAVKSGSDVLKICKLEEENKELKRLLKLAVEDIRYLLMYADYYHCYKACCRDCVLSSNHTDIEQCINLCDWKHAEEAMKILEDNNV